jgi:para-nitrobenzyl esterase
VHVARTAGLGAALLALGCSTHPSPQSPPAADPASRRALPAGEVVGAAGARGSHVWKGIPYAQPPLGELRWRAPQALPRWSEPREALDFGAICPQLASRFGGEQGIAAGTPVGHEDCLTLNVWAPAFAPEAVPEDSERLPVMLWIHGGGNVVGSGRFYDGGRLAASQRVIVVSVNYRLGPLGWFRHAALRSDGSSAEDRSGNFGTLDLIRALEWLRVNAAAFGGDPGNITVFGESAGGRNVMSLVMSPRARGLFQRAISQSGGIGTTPLADAEHAADAGDAAGHVNSSQEVLLRLLAADASPGDRAGALARAAQMSLPETAALLRGTDPARLIAAYQRERFEGLPAVPQIFRDGVVIPDAEPLELLERPGGAAPVPVLLGSNRDENKLFLAFDRNYVRWWLGLVPRIADPAAYDLTARYLSRMWKATAVDEPASALRSAGHANVFAYRFDWDEEPTVFGLVDVGELVGAAHGFEIPFVFGHWDLGPMSNWLFSDENAEGREWLSERMMSYWAEFAHTGSPGRGRDGALPEWPRWQLSGTGESPSMVFDTLAGGGLRIESRTESSRALIEEIAADPQLASPAERCAVYRELAFFGRSFDARAYAARAECREFPLD